MSIHHKIDYIEFAGGVLEKTKKFYMAAFDWKFTDYGSEYAAFSDGVVSGGFDATAKPGCSPLVIFYSEMLEETKDTVINAGGTLVKDIYSFPGGRRFHFTDPAGNELAVWSDK